MILSFYSSVGYRVSGGGGGWGGGLSVSFKVYNCPFHPPILAWGHCKWDGVTRFQKGWVWKQCRKFQKPPDWCTWWIQQNLCFRQGVSQSAPFHLYGEACLAGYSERILTSEARKHWSDYTNIGLVWSPQRPTAQDLHLILFGSMLRLMLEAEAISCLSSLSP